MKMSRQFSRLLLAAVTLAVTAACADEPTRSVTPPLLGTGTSQRVGVRVPDRYIVVFKDEVRDAPGLARALAATHGASLHHMYQHALKGFAATLTPSAVEALRRNPNVDYIEEDRFAMHGQASQQNATWGLDRVDQRLLPLTTAYTYARTGAGVSVYVIDTGIHTSHGQFGGRARVGYDALGGNGQDCNGHGTHVAGTIGGVTYGVAKAVSLISVRVFPCSGDSPWSTVIAGVDWVRANHQKPAVANLSLWGGASTAMDNALRSLIASGVLAVVISGNDSQDACGYSPARVSEALTVAAVDRFDYQSWFSNYGSCVDLYAPGEAITSAWLNGGTNTISGTSMAAPHAAGATALYLQAKLNATPAQAHLRAVANATPGILSGVGPGTPNRLLVTLFGSEHGRRTPIHRMYHPGWTDHMYGQFPSEGSDVGYQLERLDYFYLASAATTGHIPLYRCLAVDQVSHSLSVNGSCGSAAQEGVMGYIATTQLPGTVPLYRLYHSGYLDTFYAISLAGAQDAVATYGFVNQGVTGYVYPDP